MLVKYFVNIKYYKKKTINEKLSTLYCPPTLLAGVQPDQRINRYRPHKTDKERQTH